MAFATLRGFWPGRAAPGSGTVLLREPRSSAARDGRSRPRPPRPAHPRRDRQLCRPAGAGRGRRRRRRRDRRRRGRPGRARSPATTWPSSSRYLGALGGGRGGRAAQPDRARGRVAPRPRRRRRDGRGRLARPRGPRRRGGRRTARCCRRGPRRPEHRAVRRARRRRPGGAAVHERHRRRAACRDPHPRLAAREPRAGAAAPRARTAAPTTSGSASCRASTSSGSTSCSACRCTRARRCRSWSTSTRPARCGACASDGVTTIAAVPAIYDGVARRSTSRRARRRVRHGAPRGLGRGGARRRDRRARCATASASPCTRATASPRHRRSCRPRRSDAGLRPGSIGPPLPGVEVRLVDVDGTDVLAGDPGEVWVTRRRTSSRATGTTPRRRRGCSPPTAGCAPATSRSPTTTGGSPSSTGPKDLVIVSGFNVYPAEVEEVLIEHPDVAEAAVVGEPHPRTGEAVVAFVVPAEGHDARPARPRPLRAGRLGPLQVADPGRGRRRGAAHLRRQDRAARARRTGRATGPTPPTNPA